MPVITRRSALLMTLEDQRSLRLELDIPLCIERAGNYHDWFVDTLLQQHNAFILGEPPLIRCQKIVSLLNFVFEHFDHYAENSSYHSVYILIACNLLTSSAKLLINMTDSSYFDLDPDRCEALAEMLSTLSSNCVAFLRNAV